MSLSTQDRILIEQRVTNEAKSTGVAYLLWFFTGLIGGHRFYLGRIGTAVMQLILTIIGWATVALVVGIVPLIVVGVWVLIDAFLIPGMIQGHKNDVRQKLTTEAVMYTGIGRETEPKL